MSISTRISISWAPSFTPTEPTDTLVLTGKTFFVDQRLTIPPSASTSPTPASDLSGYTVSWAFGGTRSSTPIPSKLGHSKCQWKHLVSSRENVGEAVDEGIMQPHPNYPNDEEIALETGSMVNPDTGELTDYQEVWKDVVPEKGSRVEFWEYSGGYSVGEDDRGIIGIVGGYAIGVGRTEGEFWTWRAVDVEKEGWRLVYEKGGKRGWGFLDLKRVLEGMKMGDGLVTEDATVPREEGGDWKRTWVCREAWKVEE
ncbi:hypothetical protein ABW19_dt0203846 [Dactylella cylindrospora]|nr:hypothetical protein ABW19_dt0203846 [Dactylella cylindrospora]